MSSSDNHKTVMTPEHLAKFTKRRYREICADWIEPGVIVRVQSLTEKERWECERQVLDGGEDLRTVLLCATLVDENGHRLFADTSFLEGIDADLLEAIYLEVDQHCSEIQRRASVENRVKNYERIRGDDLQSD